MSERTTLASLTAEERQLLDNYRLMTPGQQRAFHRFGELMLEAQTRGEGMTWVIEQLEATGDLDCREIADHLRRERS